MSRKRRTFDIAMPDDARVDVAPPPAAEARRGPMASAIVENAEALKARKAQAAAIREENDALAHEYIAAKRDGQVVERVALDDVKTTLLSRDRMPGPDQELDDLVTSIRETGLSNPIRVVPTAGETEVELVQGWRRLQAFRRLHEEAGDAAYASIPALKLPEAPDTAGLYRRMVDENVIRKDLSFAEMAMAARHFAADPRTETFATDEAVAELFKSAAYSKRSYIRAFVHLLDMLDQHLRYAEEIPRALGVSLSREMKARPEIIGWIKADLDALDDMGGRRIDEELGVLRKYLREEAAPDEGTAAPKAVSGRKGAGAAKVTFRVSGRAGAVRCIASDGRIEIKGDKDFGAVDRARLTAAIRTLLDSLE